MPIDSDAKSRNAKHHPSSNFFIDLSEALRKGLQSSFFIAILKEDILFYSFVMKHYCSHPNPVMIIMFMAERYHKYRTITRIRIPGVAADAAILLLLPPHHARQKINDKIICKQK